MTYPNGIFIGVVIALLGFIAVEIPFAGYGLNLSTPTATSCTQYNYLYIDGATVTIDGKGVEGSSITATSSVKCQ